MAAFRSSKMRLWSDDPSSGQGTLALGKKDEKIGLSSNHGYQSARPKGQQAPEKIVSVKQPLAEAHQENR